MASPDSLTSATCTHCKPALICEDNRVPMVNLPFLVFSGECRLSCTVLDCEHMRTLGLYSTLIPPFMQETCMNGHFVGLCKCSSCTSLHKKQIPLWLLSCCPSMALSSFPCVKACLLVSFLSLPFLRLCRETQQTFLQWHI